MTTNEAAKSDVLRAAEWLASHEPGTPVPDWVDAAMNMSPAPPAEPAQPAPPVAQAERQTRNDVGYPVWIETRGASEWMVVGGNAVTRQREGQDFTEVVLRIHRAIDRERAAARDETVNRICENAVFPIFKHAAIREAAALPPAEKERR